MWQYKHTDELYHYGIPGMKWGQRKSNYVKRVIRGHAGPSIHLSRKKQLAADKRDLEGLKKGQHLSVGITKKRQAAYDRRDQRMLERRIAKNEAYFKKKADANSRISKDSRRVTKLRKKPIKELSNDDLKTINKRLEMETKYKELSGKSNRGKQIVQGLIATGTTIAALETAAKTYKRVGQYAVNKLGKKK